MKLSVIIPCYNERQTIEEIIRRVESVNIDKEIIVVDDGSTDGTREILRRITKEKPHVKVIFHEKNQGKGGAVRTGVQHATGDYIIIQDADFEYFPEDYPHLLEPIEKKEAEIVFGSRILNKNNPKGSIFYYLGRVSITWVANLLFGTRLTDCYTCYKIFPSELIKSFEIESRGFELEAELTARAALSGRKITEVPIRYAPRSEEEGKKIRLKDWFKGFWTFLKFRFGRSVP
ncbi:MAG: glycosyltransferase family 2 protein [candidate division WOR-3 bacterium]